MAAEQAVIVQVGKISSPGSIPKAPTAQGPVDQELTKIHVLL